MIATVAEIRIALGLAATITDSDRSLIEMLMPMVKGAIINDPDWGLMYDPETATNRVEWYPRSDRIAEGGSPGIWDVNDAGTRAFYRSANRSTLLQLAALPVRSVSEVKVDFAGGFGQKADTFGASTIQTAGEDYFQELTQAGFNPSGVLCSNIGWPIEPGSIKVTYSSGYTAEEFAGQSSTFIDASAIKQAFIITLIKAFRTIKSQQKSRAGFTAGPITSERLGDYNYAIDASGASMLTGMNVSVPPEAGQKLQQFRHYGLMMV